MLNRISHSFAALTREISCSTLEINFIFPRNHVIFSIILLVTRLLFFAADDSSERDLVVYNITSGEVTTLYNANSRSIRLTVDRQNQIIYWISYNADGSSLMLRKTDYSANTTLITSSFGAHGQPAVTHIGDYYYVLDSTESIIHKYNKSTDAVVQNIAVYGGATDIIGTKGLWIFVVKSWVSQKRYRCLI